MTRNIKNFYNENQFPGHYTKESFSHHIPKIKNPFLKIIDKVLKKENKKNIVDIGCGTGFISNFFAFLYPKHNFYSFDFSTAINYSKKFAKQNKILNVLYQKKNLLTIKVKQKFDIVICQGVLHHIPNEKKAIKKIKNFVDKNGYLILSVYHPTGKILKNFYKISYQNKILEKDQESVPYEKCYSKNKILKNFKEFEIIDQYPKNIYAHFLFRPIKHSQNGGLITYVFRKIS